MQISTISYGLALDIALPNTRNLSPSLNSPSLAGLNDYGNAVVVRVLYPSALLSPDPPVYTPFPRS